MRDILRRLGPTRHRSIIGVVGGFAVLATAWSMAASSAADAAFKTFWEADSSSEASKAADEVVKSAIAFDEAFARLRAGRRYSAKVPRGIVRSSRGSGNREFFYDLNVPDNYNPARRYQVRFHLHGGVMGRDTNQPRGNGSIGTLVGAEQIYVIPYSWTDAPWWGDLQLENLNGILDAVKRTYNVDENRVALAGVSDGGSAAFYFAMRDTTPFASFLPLIGSLLVLTHPDTGVDVLFPHNLTNKPFFIVNSGLDRLYPTSVVEPYLDHLKAGGVTMAYHPQPDGGHNTRWWPEVKEAFEMFVREHPRAPYPARLTWESPAAGQANRAHWLVIDRWRTSFESALLPDINLYRRTTAEGYTLRPIELFPHGQPSGRVDLVRTGNTVEARTRNVAEMTLLLSPDVFDFAQPVKVVANGKVVFEGRVEKSVATLMKWAARDNDRTMLFGAELRIKIGP